MEPKSELHVPLKQVSHGQQHHHDHNDHHDQDHHSNSIKAKNKLISVCFFCFLFMTLEFFGGFYASSLAIMTDAAHLLSDLSGFVISIVALQLSTNKPTEDFSLGYFRAEIIGALLSILIIWILTVLFFFESISRIFEPHYQIDEKLMLITASIGLVINLIMVYILHSGVLLLK
jgi:solute carrier family 30 (zinc transporter), member 2